MSVVLDLFGFECGLIICRERKKCTIHSRELGKLVDCEILSDNEPNKFFFNEPLVCFRILSATLFATRTALLSFFAANKTLRRAK